MKSLNVFPAQCVKGEGHIDVVHAQLLSQRLFLLMRQKGAFFLIRPIINHNLKAQLVQLAEILCKWCIGKRDLRIKMADIHNLFPFIQRFLSNM